MNNKFNMTLLKKIVSQDIIQNNENDNIFIKITLDTMDTIKFKFISTNFSSNQIINLAEEENRNIFLERLILLLRFKN